MVEIKSMKLKDAHYMGILLHLPRYPVYLLMSTKVLLVQEVFSMDFFEKNDKSIAILMTSYSQGFDSLLSSRIIQLNKEAYSRGAREGMLAKDALMLCES